MEILAEQKKVMKAKKNWQKLIPYILKWPKYLCSSVETTLTQNAETKI